MKNRLVVAAVFIFLIALYFVIEKVFVSPDKKLSDQEQKDLAEVKYYKEIGESFRIDSLEFTIRSFDIQAENDGIALVIDLEIQSQLENDSLVQSTFLILKMKRVKFSCRNAVC